jgi:mRNA-degrading endonuclease RelE of RelBE toxin-antitoxin system
VRALLRASLDRIRANPEAGKRLVGAFAGRRSWRIGSYRIIYEYSGGMVWVAAVGHRSSIYRQP